MKYKYLSKFFEQNNIYFTVNGASRHNDEDIIGLNNGAKIEPYTGFLSGNNICTMGAFSYSWSPLPKNMKIGRYCSIARGVSFLGARHPMERISTSSFTYDKNFSIFRNLIELENSEFQIKGIKSNPKFSLIVGSDVWIGANVTFKNGLTIGTGSVIAANSVVVKDVPPYSVVGGNPAKIIKSRFSDKEINILLQSHWWNYKFSDFSGLDLENVEFFCEKLNDKIEKKLIKPYTPNSIVWRDEGFVQEEF